MEHNSILIKTSSSHYHEVAKSDNKIIHLFTPKETKGKLNAISNVNASTVKYGLPEQLTNLAECLCKSEQILELGENWDDMGSEGFTQETWNGVAQFLVIYAKYVYSELKRCIDIPKIYPSGTGSIDIDWETDSYGLLVNVAKGGNYATYYADDKERQVTEGAFNPHSFNVNLLPIAISPIKNEQLKYRIYK